MKKLRDLRGNIKYHISKMLYSRFFMFLNKLVYDFS